MRKFMWSVLIAGAARTANAGEAPPNTPVVSIAIASVASAESPANVKLAAKEIRRYIYLRTGVLPVIQEDRSYESHGTYVNLLINPALKPQEFHLKTHGNTLTISGGSDVGVLYGAYRYAELLGVRFYLHGDVIPDVRLKELPVVKEETGKPLFELRGIQPFHDFPEGPDWWTTQDYRAYIAQLAKMRMNFIGFHNYPGEFLLWHGVADDVNPDGTVKTTYPSKWFSTARSGWGYAATPTREFTAGASQLFADEVAQSEVVGKDDRHFDRVAKMFGTIVKDAHALGIKVAAGTETPLRIPGPVQARLKALGRKNAIEEVYRGTFTWLMKNAPVDYYWAWTPEGWIWHGNSVAAYQSVEGDLKSAQAAARALGNPFPVGTCGWVLGPQQNRAAWDELLAPDAPIANINPLAGHAPIDPSFSSISGRPKWAIPWFENDPDMIGYQPWVKRTRYDAADALRRGCTGLMGIHWRTKILSQNISALAQAGWDQSWARPDLLLKTVHTNPGQAVAFTNAVADTEQDAVYQALRFGLDGYPVEVPNGLYTVTLKFNEPHHNQPGKRVFDVRLQGAPVAERLDVFARVGKDRAYDLAVPGVRVENGLLDIRFTAVVEYPFLSAVEITGMTAAANQLGPQPYARRINVGGPAWRDYEADAIPAETVDGGLVRAMPADDFYQDFARAHFGDAVAAAAGRILADADGFGAAFNPKYPGFSATTEWQGGPGALRSIREPWDAWRKEHYAFADSFAALRPQVEGTGNLERFDYWSHTLRATEQMARLACQRGALDGAVEKMNAEKEPATKKRLAEAALALRQDLARGWEQLITLQIQLVSTPGELGTIANLEMHTRRNNQWLTAHDKTLAAALGAPLPADCAPSQTYAGPPKLAVLTVRGSATKGEELILPIIALPATEISVHIRPLGKGDWQRIPVRHIARAVYEAMLPAAQEDFEYYITAGENHVWPATAPNICQTVVVLEADGR